MISCIFDLHIAVWYAMRRLVLFADIRSMSRAEFALSEEKPLGMRMQNYRFEFFGAF